MSFQQQKIKGVIFDLDETIIDSLGAYTEAFNRGTRTFGLKPVTEERIAHFLDKGFRLGQILSALFPSIFEEEEKRQVCEYEIRKAYLGIEAQKVGLKPGVKQTLQSLKEKGIKIGIVTGRMTKGEHKWLELSRLNIRRLVDAMVTAAEAPAKPAPDGLIKCIEELGLSAEECIFVGDSRVDIMAGKKAGVRTVAVHTGVADKELLIEQGADYILPDLNSLLCCLDELQKPTESKMGSITIKGEINEGLKESSFFIHLPWVREQFIAKLGIDPYPGTLNLDIFDAADKEKLSEIKKRKGVEIIPAEPGFCLAKCFPVLVCGKIKGALIIPQVPDYPESKLEIISSDKVREVLSLKVGDLVKVDIL